MVAACPGVALPEIGVCCRTVSPGKREGLRYVPMLGVVCVHLSVLCQSDVSEGDLGSD